jgi:dTDP-L-rhamnose 4-epimerase
MSTVLVTGGAGFIGGAIVSRLHSEGRHDVTVIDNFSPQIHGDDHTQSYLYKRIRGKCSVVQGDVRDKSDLNRVPKVVDAVIHLAAETGTGQSMYEIGRYTDVNIVGTAALLESILTGTIQAKKIVLASSRAVYGEGMHICRSHGVVVPNSRCVDDMSNGDFDNKCPFCSRAVEPTKTAEDSRLSPISYYAFTKLAQEKMLETMCPMIGLPYTIFRYQNVYGMGQSLRNPYTGIISIFSNLLLENRTVSVFEDGRASRDFIGVNDVAWITCDAIENRLTDGECINVGSGLSRSVLEVAEMLKVLYGSSSEIRVTGGFRKGDIRHSASTTEKALALCSFKPQQTFEEGIREFVAWARIEHARASTRTIEYERSLEEMRRNGIYIRGEQD